MPADTFITLLSHFTSWNDLAGKPAVVTYSFAADGPAGFAPFSAQQQASARSALAAWDRISGLSFVELPDTPGGAGIDLRFGLEVMNSPTILGQTELPPDGDVALNIALFRTDSLAPSATRIGYQTLLHEIGHGLGLAHPDATIPAAAQNTLMVATLGQTQPVNAPLAWDRAAIQSLYGTQEAETLRWSWDACLGAVRGEGTPGDDVMTGTAHRDALFGGAGTDMLRGAAGNDLLTPGLGDDVVEGGAGFDTLALGVTRAAMTFNPAGAVESAEGRDRFSDIEALRSLDGTTYLQAPDGLASLVGLYAAALGRAPDPGGLAFWWNTMQGGASLGSIAQGFLDSAEFQAGPGLAAAFNCAARRHRHCSTLMPWPGWPAGPIPPPYSPKGCGCPMWKASWWRNSTPSAWAAIRTRPAINPGWRIAMPGCPTSRSRPASSIAPRPRCMGHRPGQAPRRCWPRPGPACGRIMARVSSLPDGLTAPR